MVYLFLANGFEEVEALTSVDYMRRSGISVKTVGISVRSNEVIGSHGITVICDILPDEINYSDIEMIILPGGPGAALLESDENVQKAIDYCAENNKYIAAICAAPGIIGKKGLLSGKKATAYPGYEKYLKGAVVCDEDVCIDGKYITARAAGASGKFAFTIIEALLSKEEADKIKKLVLF